MTKQIVYTCPVCGHDLVEMCLTSYPPQYIQKCFFCGWSGMDKEDQVKIVRVPYGSEKK